MSDLHAPTKRANKVADWIEVTALARGVAVGSDALHALGREVGYKQADVALGLSTMTRRAALLGAAYPFRVASGAAALQSADARAWTALLLMSPEAPNRQELDIDQAAVHLEAITAEALTALYGPGTDSVRFGWPSNEGRPREFPDAIRWLAKKMNVPIGGSFRPPHAKDGGVDVIAWRSFPDGRSGFPVLLAQCTVERDYSHKANDIDLRVWSGWLALNFDPATALAVPDVVAAGEQWNALAARTIVLDRIRLASLLAGSEDGRPRLGPVMEWSRKQIATLRGMQ